jgi:hypothetical protein
MNKKEYADYEANVAEFFSHGLRNLSSKSESFFSWSPCDCCGGLAGNRYECDGYNEKTKEVEEYSCICEDCVYYAEYGRLDDAPCY